MTTVLLIITVSITLFLIIEGLTRTVVLVPLWSREFLFGGISLWLEFLLIMESWGLRPAYMSLSQVAFLYSVLPLRMA